MTPASRSVLTPKAASEEKEYRQRNRLEVGQNYFFPSFFPSWSELLFFIVFGYSRRSSEFRHCDCLETLEFWICTFVPGIFGLHIALRTSVVDYVMEKFNTSDGAERFESHHGMSVHEWAAWMRQDGIYGNIHVEYTHFLSHTCTCTHTHTFTFSLSHAHTVALSLTPVHARTRTHSHSRSHTHTLSLSLDPTIAPFVFPFNSFPLYGFSVSIFHLKSLSLLIILFISVCPSSSFSLSHAPSRFLSGALSLSVSLTFSVSLCNSVAR